MESDPLILVFIPALVVLLAHHEKAKGAQLTQDEVLAIRDKGVCVMMPASRAIVLDQSRGYNDIDPRRCWEHWLEYKAATGRGSGDKKSEPAA